MFLSLALGPQALCGTNVGHHSRSCLGICVRTFLVHIKELQIDLVSCICFTVYFKYLALGFIFSLISQFTQVRIQKSDSKD